MVERDNDTIRAIAWSEIFPWLKIVRAFRTAITARALVLGAIGILLTVSGWAGVGKLCGTDTYATGWLEPFTGCPWLAITDEVPDRPSLPIPAATPAQPMDENPVSAVWSQLTSPALEGLAYTGISIRAVAAVLLCGVWAVAVWALFGGAICRIAAVDIAADEQVGLFASLRYAVRKWPSYFAAPLMPVGGVVLATIPLVVLGWIMHFNVGLLLGGILWPLVLVASLLMTLLLLGLLFGWPLMWGTISAEGTDSFDALSRSYAYTFQRPLHYLFYAAVAGFIGWLGWLLVRNFAAGVVWLGYWGAGWGCGEARITEIINSELSGTAALGAWLIRFFAECVKLLAVGFLYSYFWSAATIIYFLLRRHVDATEMDEVYLDADASEEQVSLPTITTDAAGAPSAESESTGPVA